MIVHKKFKTKEPETHLLLKLCPHLIIVYLKFALIPCWLQFVTRLFSIETAQFSLPELLALFIQSWVPILASPFKLSFPYSVQRQSILTWITAGKPTSEKQRNTTSTMTDVLCNPQLPHINFRQVSTKRSLSRNLSEEKWILNETFLASTCLPYFYCR